MKNNKNHISLPVLSLRGVVVFPKAVVNFDVGRLMLVKGLKAAVNCDRKLFLVSQKNPSVSDPELEDLYKVGVVAEIKQLYKRTDTDVRILVEGLYKAKIVDLCPNSEYLECVVQRIPSPRKIKEITPEIEALMRAIKNIFTRYCEIVPKMPDDIVDSILAEDDPYELFYSIVSNIFFKSDDKQALLEQNDIMSELNGLLDMLNRETAVLSFESDIFDKVKDQLGRGQKEHFLREQMKVISNELYGVDEDEEIREYFDAIDSIENISDDSREHLIKEAEKLLRMSSSSPESSVVRNYLDACLELPWDTQTKDKINIQAARKVLDSDHYGLSKVKDRIIEHLAVRQLAPDLKPHIICLSGPPGVGKTSVAKSIARSIGRKYVRISLGGVRDEADIRGHRKTYIGSMPGRIINAFREVKVKNPLILLDEIDKLGSDFKGDPSAAMLEVLDSEQNNAFRDHYLEIPFDLSEAMFITTANNTGTIPAPLLDRMEVIEITSYTRDEKFNIAKKHLLSKQFKKHGLSSKTVKIKDSVLFILIDNYSRESGVRKLERLIASLCRKAAKEIAAGESEIVRFTEKNLESYLGPKKYLVDYIDKSNEVGLANGLAWTSVGGEMLKIEVSILNGTGKLELTGSLGDVMKESAKIAVSYVRSIAERYEIEKDFYKKCDIHIHAPDGAVPKDGPSAGITLTTALVSALSGIPVRHDVAMTGEVTLRGKVLSIGGLKEKAMAAHRAGVKTVIIPKENLADLSEIDSTVRDSIEFVPADDMSVVLKTALAGKQKKAKSDFKEIDENFIIPEEALNIDNTRNAIY